MAVSIRNPKSLKEKPQQKNGIFYEDIISGLRMAPKQLPSKYFYDETGDRLFREIMNTPEYYLTACEMEIFTNQTKKLASSITENYDEFELIELGPGDCSKSFFLLKELSEQNIHYVFTPIDISENIIMDIKHSLPKKLPGIYISPLNGEYFAMLEKTNSGPGFPKVILCLGANIGNMTMDDCYVFCKRMRTYMQPGDMAIIGFDLKKNPRVIRSAYDDSLGITRKFNFNLLNRINRELGADFNADYFEHYCSYDPQTGSCKSYLICLKDMVVHFADDVFYFKKDEYIWVEISQKYSLNEINELATKTGFFPKKNILDSKGWFTDAIWVAE